MITLLATLVLIGLVFIVMALIGFAGMFALYGLKIVILILTGLLIAKFTMWLIKKLFG